VQQGGGLGVQVGVGVLAERGGSGPGQGRLEQPSPWRDRMPL
jgi:hypothetical protein